MDLYRYHAAALDIVQIILLGLDYTFDDWIYQFEVAGVWTERKVNLATAVFGDIIVGISLVIFYIAFVLGAFALHRTLKFTQDDLIGFVEQVGQNIEAPPVGHADDHLIDIQ